MKWLVAVVPLLVLLVVSPATWAHHGPWVPSCAWVHPEAGRVRRESAALLKQGRWDPQALEQAAMDVTRFFKQVISQEEVFVDNTSPFGSITYRVPPMPCGRG